MTRIKLTLFTAAAILAIAGCSTSHSGGTTHKSGTKHPANAPATSAPASSAAAAGQLSGKWSGRYSGAYNGTFVLRWRQSGSKLGGHIHLSAPATTLVIHGTVHGNTIRFGTVGSAAITYSGTVSGSSMSGHYAVHNASGPTGGPWSASKG